MSYLQDPGLAVVLAVRLIGPLLILKWPLGGTLLSQFVFDMFDVVIWDAAGTLKNIDYTFVEKPLDLYQLTLQLITVFWWKQSTPKRIAIGLYMYRLIGFVTYEFVHDRIIFLLFPNFFLVFFLIYLVALKMKKGYWFENKRSLAFILIAILMIKIPQEYVLHYVEFSPWEAMKQRYPF